MTEFALANDTTEHWAARIRTAWQKTVESIFKTGEEILNAKADARCRFADMRLPFGIPTASKLGSIAADRRLREISQAKLPAHWDSLYHLTQLDDEDFRAHQNEITPELERSTIEGWRKKSRRAQRELDLADKTNALSGQYAVILADPPWRFEPYSRETGMDRAADNHYPTLTLDDIKVIAIPAAPDCVLFLWATVPMLPQALDLMETWGFAYKSHFVWDKGTLGTGYWVRNAHELLLIGTRGDIPAPAPGEQYASIIEADIGPHSQKPFQFHEIIEDMFPNLPRIELFARQRYAGWDAWGNEVMP